MSDNDDPPCVGHDRLADIHPIDNHALTSTVDRGHHNHALTSTVNRGQNHVLTSTVDTGNRGQKHALTSTVNRGHNHELTVTMDRPCYHITNVFGQSQQKSQQSSTNGIQESSYNYIGQVQQQHRHQVDDCLQEDCEGAATGLDHLVPDWVEYLSGGSAAIVNIAATFPINKLIFRQQLFSIRLPKAVKQLRHEGLRHLYRGVLPPLIQRTVTLSMMFGLYDQYTRIILNKFPNCSLMSAQMMAAVLSGTTEAVMTPFERIQTLLQDNRQRRYYNNSIHAFKVLQQHGITEYYRGLVPILLRNGPSNAIFFAFRGHLKKVLPEATSRTHEVANDFISGAVLGAVLSTVWYPLNVVKTRMQVKAGGKFMTTWGTFRLIYEERGRKWPKMFRGVQLNFSRALLSWGIINASYEFFKGHFSRLKGADDGL